MDILEVNENMTKEELREEVLRLRGLIFRAAPTRWVRDYNLEEAQKWEGDALILLGLSAIR